MPRNSPKFIPEYLIPSLNSERFGEHLKWIDEEKSTFQLDWSHKGGSKWSKRGADVFAEWDKIKGHFHPEDKQYYSKSKQRFRAMLYKLNNLGEIKELQSGDKFIKFYAIGEKKQKKRKQPLNDSSAGEKNRKKQPLNDSSADETQSEDSDVMCSYPLCVNRNMCTDETDSRIPSNDNFVTNELQDHNYSSPDKSLNMLSDCKDQVNEDPFSSYEFPENLEKKVLVERNYPTSAYVNTLALKDMNDLNNISEDLLSDIEWLDLKNLTSKTEEENKIPTISIEQKVNLPSPELVDDTSCLFNLVDFLDADCGEFTSNFLKHLQA